MVDIKGMKVKQGNYQFVLQKITVAKLKLFTRFTERILMGLDEDDKPIYNDYFQRKLDTSKVNKIADFLIDDPNSIFPTNIVLAVPEEVITITNETDNELEFKILDKVVTELDSNVYITIVDGQHRIRGIEIALERLTKDIDVLFSIIGTSANNDLQKKYNKFTEARDKLLNFELIVTYALNATIDFQASIFSIINRTQTKVPENLVQSLFGLTDRESPQKTALEITLALNAHPDSPFYKRIKLYGHKNQIITETPVITQSSLVKAIVKLISINIREAERDRFRDRKDLILNISPHLCFRKYYAKNEDQKIINILFAYFKCVELSLLDPTGNSYWSLGNPVKNVLQATVGFESLLNILPFILSKIDEEKKQTIKAYLPFIEKLKNVEYVNFEKFPLASIGKTKLTDEFMSLLSK